MMAKGPLPELLLRPGNGLPQPLNLCGHRVALSSERRPLGGGLCKACRSLTHAKGKIEAQHGRKEPTEQALHKGFSLEWLRFRENGIAFIVTDFPQDEKSFFACFRKKIPLFFMNRRIFRRSRPIPWKQRRKSRKSGGLKVRKYTAAPRKIPKQVYSRSP